MKVTNLSIVISGVALLAATSVFAEPGLWTDPKDQTLPPDFQIQGEFAGDQLGAQVIALGEGRFQAVLFYGGLPGAGWDQKNRSVMEGTLDGKGATFKPAEGSRKYLAGKPDEFSATAKFPPAGNQPYTGAIAGDTFTGKSADGTAFTLTKVNRVSETMGAKAPEGAKILFDGSNKDAFDGGRVDEKTQLLNTDGQDIKTKDKFNNYTMHVEFMLPFKPAARGQGRGNSGFYQVDHYEVQILDSFGLEGENNECGGVYTKAKPLINMCAPPLSWQTYDVEFTNSVADKDGKKVKNAVMTLKHNGVVIHDKLEIEGKTGGSRNEPEGTPGVIKLQGHGNPLQYRNIWIVEKP
ncbi:MAG: DUF1080 domain-containing protein [Verrucomicrobiales bacterium]|nr:DUF1080 domain-containing protein [Verrucomicrobiales bacterium]